MASNLNLNTYKSQISENFLVLSFSFSIYDIARLESSLAKLRAWVRCDIVMGPGKSKHFMHVKHLKDQSQRWENI